MLHSRKMLWLGVLVVVLIGLIGCSLFDRDQLTNPTTPVENGAQVANFFVSEAEGTNYGVFTDFDMFLVKVPAGDYKLTYTTSLGTHQIVFRATAPTVMTVGLLAGDRVVTAKIEKGTIPATATVVYQEKTLLIFSWPDHQPADISTIFTDDETLPEVNLVQNAQVVQGANVELLAGFQEPFSASVSVDATGFTVFVPKGDYLLQYSLATGGIFQILFRVVADQAMLFVPFVNSTDKLDDVTLQKGTIPVEAVQVGQTESGDILFFYLPGQGNLEAIGFIPDPNFPLLPLVQDGQVVASTTDGTVTEMKQRYTISTIAGECGTIKPKTSTVPAGASRSFKIIPDKTCVLEQVKIDGVPVDVQILGNGQGHYVFHKVDKDHTLEATFIEKIGGGKPPKPPKP